MARQPPAGESAPPTATISGASATGDSHEQNSHEQKHGGCSGTDRNASPATDLSCRLKVVRDEIAVYRKTFR